MRKLAIVACFAFMSLLQGCGGCSRFAATLTGYDEVCIGGVTYIQFASGATIKVDTTGKPVKCAD